MESFPIQSKSGGRKHVPFEMSLMSLELRKTNPLIQLKMMKGIWGSELTTRKVWMEFIYVDETFDSTFNKEIELDMNEVPTVLFELHENSLLYMDREEWDRAL